MPFSLTGVFPLDPSAIDLETLGPSRQMQPDDARQGFHPTQTLLDENVQQLVLKDSPKAAGMAQTVGHHGATT